MITPEAILSHFGPLFGLIEPLLTKKYLGVFVSDHVKKKIGRVIAIFLIEARFSQNFPKLKMVKSQLVFKIFSFSFVFPNNRFLSLCGVPEVSESPGAAMLVFFNFVVISC